jgi:hypothetical protein
MPGSDAEREWVVGNKAEEFEGKEGGLGKL